MDKVNCGIHGFLTGMCFEYLLRVEFSIYPFICMISSFTVVVLLVIDGINKNEHHG